MPGGPWTGILQAMSSVELQLAGLDVETSDYVEFYASGTRAKGEFRCADCWYGVVVTRELPLCPMCGGHVWEGTGWRPFRRPAA
jgi:hypothetical protein